VILEDYVKPEGRRIVAVWLVKGVCALLAPGLRLLHPEDRRGELTAA
jgi:hypothetical protein